MSTLYTDDHEWIRVEGDVGVVGISKYAAEQLGDVVFVELPEIGKAVEKGAEAAVVESVKAASEIYAPVSGSIVEVNAALGEAPETLNADPEGAGWIMKIKLKDKAQLGSLKDAAAYAAFVEGL
jgi:glycine cleavage system H protein